MQLVPQKQKSIWLKGDLVRAEMGYIAWDQNLGLLMMDIFDNP